MNKKYLYEQASCATKHYQDCLSKYA